MHKGLEMKAVEANVLNYIVNNGTAEKPLKAWKIRQEFNLSKRKLEEVIETLRLVFEHPIVAKKTQPSGYYVARTIDELNEGMRAYKNQIIRSQEIVSTLMKIDLDEYWGRKETENA